jgi:molybdenum cofactor guanylyltransferase
MKSIENHLTGVVLCGGQSTRMGSDKGLMKKGEHTWAETAFNKLKSIASAVVVSVNESQLLFYKNIFSQEDLIVDSVDINGPLKGVLTVHKKYPGKDLLVLACDLVDLDLEVLVYLLNEYEGKRNSYDFFVYKNNNEYEPLCGIYTSAGLKNILTIYNSGNLKKSSMKYILDLGNTFPITLPEKFKNSFINYNESNHLPL